MFIENNNISFGNPNGINWSQENIGKRIILISFELRNTGTRTILTQFWTEKYWNTNHFQFSSKIHFLDHKIQDPSCRIDSYGPYGPFWFSVKKGRDMKKRHKKIKIGKSHFLRLSGKWINSSGVSFQKLAYVRLLPQGLLFLPNSHFWKFQTCPFCKKCPFSYIWAFPRWRRRRRRSADNFSIWPEP